MNFRGIRCFDRKYLAHYGSGSEEFGAGEGGGGTCENMANIYEIIVRRENSEVVENGGNRV